MNKVFCCLMAACLLLLGCAKSKTKSKSPTDTLRISFMHTPVTIDPRRTGDAVSSCMSFMLFESLTYLEQDGSCSNALAESIDISEDKKTYTFHLKDTQWSDGKPITAHDFEYSWKKVLDPHFPSICPYLFFPIKGSEKASQGLISLDDVGIKALDDKTFEVTLEHPTPYFLKLIAFCVFSPVPKHIDIENPDWFKTIDEKIVCSGAFKIQSWEHEREIRVTKNDKFWDAGKTGLDEIHISIIPDQNTALQMYEQNQLDWICNGITELSLDALTTLHQEGKIDSVEVGNTIFISFNVNEPPFDNINIRKAFACAIDRQAITDHVTQLSEKPAVQVFPPVLTQHTNMQLISSHAELDRAREFFDAGLKELEIDRAAFPKITLTFPSVDVYKKVGQAIQQQWKEAFGIDVASNFCEMKVFFDQLQHKSYQVAQASWAVQFPDTMNVLERFRFKDGNKNYPGWENSVYLSLLDQISATADEAERTRLVRLAEKVLVDNVPFTPVYHEDINVLCKSHVEGIEISPISDAHFRRARLKHTNDAK